MKNFLQLFVVFSNIEYLDLSWSNLVKVSAGACLDYCELLEETEGVLLQGEMKHKQLLIGLGFLLQG